MDAPRARLLCTAIALCGLLAACHTDIGIDERRFVCESDDDCLSGYSCKGGECVAAESSQDTGSADTDGDDTGVADTGRGDTDIDLDTGGDLDTGADTATTDATDTGGNDTGTVCGDVCRGFDGCADASDCLATCEALLVEGLRQCVLEASTCADLLQCEEAGTSCTSGAECTPGTTCNTDTGDCVAADTNSPCTDSPVAAICVELTWSAPAGDSTGRDVDLHYLHPDGQWGEVPGDVFWRNRDADWNDDGEYDARLVTEVTTAPGPEIVMHDAPVAGLTYTVGAHYFDTGGLGPTDVTVRVFIYGTLAYEPTDPVNLPTEKSFAKLVGIEWRTGPSSVQFSVFNELSQGLP